MLAGEQRRRHDDCHLLAVHGSNEGRAQCHFRLAEADVAADQPVHRLALLQVVQHILDGLELVFRFLIGEAGAEFVKGAFRRRHDFAGAQFTLRLPS